MHNKYILFITDNANAGFIIKQTIMKKYLLLITMCILFALNGYSFTQNVTVQSNVFTPSAFTINLGDTVRFTWVSGTHTTTSLTIPTGAASWDHPINSSSTSFVYVPSKTGTYNYKCTFHFAMGMKGNFTVVCPQATVQISAATSAEFCQGGSVLLKSSVTSSITSYQWKKNGVNIANATASTFTAKSKGSYTLKVTNNCGNTANSNAINVTVNALPKAIITPSDTVFICTGESIKLKATTGGSQTYAWKRNGNIIAGATSSSFTATTAGSYKVVVTKTTTGCSKTSATTRVIINCSNSVTGKLAGNEIKIFPNPSSNDFHISIPSFNNNQCTLSIFDINGKSEGSKKIISKDFSFGNELKPGIYFIEIKNGNAVIFKEKIIKQ